MARKQVTKVKETRDQRRARQEATSKAQETCMKIIPYVVCGLLFLLFVFAFIINRMEPEAPGSGEKTPKSQKSSSATEQTVKRKPGRIDMASISSQSELDDKCYHIKKGTCALVLHRAEEAIPEEAPLLAIKYARAPINFYTVAVGDNAYADLDFASSFTVEFSLPSIVVIKNGKRPRYTTAPAGEFEKLISELLDVGGVQFTSIDAMPKLQSGRRQREEEEEKEEEDEVVMADLDIESAVQEEEEEEEEGEVQEL